MATHSGINIISQDQLINSVSLRTISIINRGPKIDLFFIVYYSVRQSITAAIRNPNMSFVNMIANSFIL